MPMQPGEDEIDYRETADVTRVHGAVKREHKEPDAGTVPLPVWWVAIVVLVTVGAGYYFGHYDGGFSAEVYNPSEGHVGGATAGAAGEGEAKVELTLAQKGKKVYGQNCLSCHQGNGMGTAGVYPALVNSPWVIGDTKRITSLVLKGMQGPHELHGVTFNGSMPAWGGALNDDRIASVLSYIRSEWGNAASEITPAQVAVVRKELASRTEPFTHDELKAITGDIEAAP